MAVSTAIELTDEQYYQMPKLFQLDDYGECLSSRRGAFCLGTFDLLPYKNDKLLDIVKQFSADKFHFNHTHIHRGFCLSQRCSHLTDLSLKPRFEKCVNEATISQYGLETNLTRLEYCKLGSRPRTRPVDRLDMAFAYCVGVILLCNIVGTAYDVLRNPENKPNRYLLTWSLVTNWRRLTADYDDGDPRLAALKPVQGMKAITLILIMMAHSVLSYYTTYLHNPHFLEKAGHHLLSSYFQNGSCIVHTFIMVSNFLLAYNILLHSDANPKKQLGLRILPQVLMHRIVRITPVYLFVLGVATTWWSHFGDGPMWSPLIEGECHRCREKWWAQLLYINNFYRPDFKCLIHTWFLAVDMQLYVVCAMLVLALGRRPKLALRVLATLLACSVLANLAIIVNWQLRPMVTLMFPEYMRLQFEGEPSFKWLYSAPWDSLPAALIGLFVAFLHFTLQKSGCKPDQYLVIRILYRVTIPLMFLWVLSGFWMKRASAPWLVWLYASLDRPVFISLTAFAMFCFFNKVDSLVWRFLSWRGWEILGRMSLSVYLLHWLYALTQLALRAHASPASLHEIGGHWLWTIFVTYFTAVPLHLLVELPMQKFLQTLLS